jgi:hypothetical protein
MFNSFAARWSGQGLLVGISAELGLWMLLRNGIETRCQAILRYRHEIRAPL